MLSALTASLIAGLVGSPHCVGMCGPFALACGGRSAHTAAWQAGKATTYAALGAAAGFFGAALPGPQWLVGAISAALVVWFAAALAGWAPEPTARLPWVEPVATRAARGGGLASRFVLGAANGLLPCGLVYAALGLAIATGTVLGGAATMAAFALGTAPALTAFSLGGRRLVAERPWARKALAGVVLLAGLWVVAQRIDSTSAGIVWHS